MNDKLIVFARRCRNPAGELYGCRHDEAVVVVGMFAYQVDASGRTEDSRAIAESPFEVLREFA
jgi:hypothetical protein